MKKQLLSISLVTLSFLSFLAQPVTTMVSVGPGYTNQKWYSLENGEKGTQAKDNWDIAFETTGFSSAILANTQKSNFALYKTPFAIAAYGTLDTTGISGWPVLYNSDTSWAVGAFNRGADPNNPYDLGWGVYDMNTHFVNGDSCYVIKLSASSYKKLRIIKLVSGTYSFEYADINGTNSFTQTIGKSTYSTKNFVYFDFASNSIVDREPVSADWDLTFARYTAVVMAPNPTPYPVVGVMSNKGIKVTQVNNVTDPANFSDWSSQTFNSDITILGHDWKNIDMASNQWKIANDTVYFVQDKQSNIWKLRFLSFGGSTNGNFVFSKEKFSAVGILDNSGNTISNIAVYPNPCSNEVAYLLLASQGNSVLETHIQDLNGKLVHTQNFEVNEGIQTVQFPVTELSNGVYVVKIKVGSISTATKLVISK